MDDILKRRRTSSRPSLTFRNHSLHGPPRKFPLPLLLVPWSEVDQLLPYLNVEDVGYEVLPVVVAEPGDVGEARAVVHGVVLGDEDCRTVEGEGTASSKKGSDSNVESLRRAGRGEVSEASRRKGILLLTSDVLHTTLLLLSSHSHLLGLGRIVVALLLRARTLGVVPWSEVVL